jgi:hypothetical protein
MKYSMMAESNHFAVPYMAIRVVGMTPSDYDVCFN